MHALDDALAVARTFFSSDEVQRLSALTDPVAATTAFFECWTRKEAFIKAIGEGLSHPLDTFGVTFAFDDAVELRVGPDVSGRWALVNVDAPPGYKAALAFEKRGDGAVPLLIDREWHAPGCCGSASHLSR
jgi:4'-phosphopantetheinyl transferase